MASKLARNSFFGAVSGFCTIATSFVAGIIVARVLGVEGSGVVAYALWLGSIGLIFADAGFSHCIARYGPALTGAGKAGDFQSLVALLARMLILMVCFTILLVIIAASVPSISAGVWSSPESGSSASPRPPTSILWVLVGAGAAVSALSAYYYSYLRGLQQFTLWAAIVGGSSILQLMAVLFGSWKYGVAGALVGYLFGSLPAALASFVLLRPAPSMPPDLFRTAARYAAYAWGSTIVAAFVWARIEVFVLEKTWGSAAVGIFMAALAMSNLASQGPVQLSAGLLPHFSEQAGRNDTAGLLASFQTAMRLIAFLVFPCCLGMAAIMPALLPLLYGAVFAEAVPAAIIMVFGAALTAPGVATANLLYAKERTDIVFIWGLFGAVLSVAGSLLLVPLWGPIGAAWARTSIQVLLCFSGFWFIGRRLHYPIPYASLTRLFLAAAFCAVAATIASFLIDGTASILIAVPVGMIAYALAIWMLQPFPKSDLDLLRKFAERLGLSPSNS